MAEPERPVVLTIGHSTRTLEEFIDLLKAHGVDCLVDIRTVPRSRRNPQFNLESLPGSLASAGIEHLHMRDLGGLRHARPGSPNTGWRTPGFQGYADYMQTPQFEAALKELVDRAGRSRLCVMCAEAVPWRCHRSLLSDALTVRGVSVEHIMSRTRRQIHTLTAFARIDGTRLTYPGPIKEEDGQLTIFGSDGPA
jgi:uncharacterized protein (DUF488 family)